MNAEIPHVESFAKPGDGWDKMSTATTEEKTFAPGDRVALVSGGPGMTVVDIGVHTGLVWCRWNIAGGKLREAEFAAVTLVSDPRCHFVK